MFPKLYRTEAAMALSDAVAEAMDRLLPEWAAAPGIVAVSGGADSVALLTTLRDHRPSVAHVNHALRGDESDADERFVRELSERFAVPCRVLRIDMAREAAGENLEAAARALRYRWFAELAVELGAGWIATGHTADDQAETVLHRLIRGTGLQGLRGIAPIRRDEPVPVVRPLLGATRAEVVAHLAELRQPYRTDSSNADPRFTRNRIRSELLPLLKTFGADVVQSLGRTAAQAEEFFEEQRIAGERLLNEAELPASADVVTLDAGKLDALGEPAIRLLLRTLWARKGWSTAAMTFAHWDRLAKIAKRAPAADFPGGLHVRRTGRFLTIRVGRV
jgi:tRNA(Ile)-lysidine synthase